MSTVVALVHTSHYTCVHRSKIIIDVLSFIEGKLEGKYYIIIKCHMLYNMCTSEFFYPWYCKSLLGKHDFVSGILGLWSSISI